jgi:hypothetical protein
LAFFGIRDFGSAAANQLPDAQAAARALGLQLRALPASSTGEIDAAFDLIGREQILALIVSADPFLDTSRDRIIALAARAIPCPRCINSANIRWPAG